MKWMMGESWLTSATEYIAINNIPLRPEIRVDGRSGLVWHDLINWLVMPSSRANNHCLLNFPPKKQTLF